METPARSRESCPERIVDKTGEAFSVGAVGGAAFFFLDGVYNSPKGHRLTGGIHAIRMNAPRVGGRLAVWGGLFSAFNCAMFYARQKEYPWNSIIAGATAGGFHEIWKGLRPASRAALYGGIFFALMEGTLFMFEKAVDKAIEDEKKSRRVVEDYEMIKAGGEGGISFELPIRAPQFE
ncbi:hypothetical protein LguiB_018402 [Lonicera macranthoides]